LNPQVTMFGSAVDVLHVLEYLALIMRSDELKKRVDELKSRNAALVSEAIDLAKVLATTLPEEDIEMNLARRILDSLGIRIGSLFEFTGR